MPMTNSRPARPAEPCSYDPKRQAAPATLRFWGCNGNPTKMEQIPGKIRFECGNGFLHLEAYEPGTFKKPGRWSTVIMLDDKAASRAFLEDALAKLDSFNR